MDVPMQLHGMVKKDDQCCDRMYIVAANLIQTGEKRRCTEGTHSAM